MYVCVPRKFTKRTKFYPKTYKVTWYTLITVWANCRCRLADISSTRGERYILMNDGLDWFLNVISAALPNAAKPAAALTPLSK